MSQKGHIDITFIKLEYFKNKLQEYLQYVLKMEIYIKGIMLFGSLATDKAIYDENHISDIDLIIVCDELQEDLWKRRRLLVKLTKTVSSGIQALWWTSKEIKSLVASKYYLILDAFDEGRILYDPDNFLLELKTRLLKELELKGVIKTDLYWQWPIKKFGDKIEF